MRNKLELRPKIEKPKQLYELYLDNITNSDTRDYTSDIFILAKETRTPIEINAKSLNGIIRYHDSLVEKLNKKNERQFARELKIQYDTKQIWIDVDKKLKESKLNITVLNSPGLLKKEGIEMNHCVGSYIENVRRGTSYIFHIDYDDKPYTCELKITKNGETIINQIKGAYNSTAPKLLKNKIMKII